LHCSLLDGPFFFDEFFEAGDQGISVAKGGGYGGLLEFGGGKKYICISYLFKAYLRISLSSNYRFKVFSIYIL